MNYIEEAIKRAIEGGWREWPDKHRVNDDYGSYNIEAIFLDPLFWQALGKNEKWPEYCTEQNGNWDEPDTWSVTQTITWQYHMHRFIDHLIEGGTPEDFFKELLVKK